MVSSSPLSFPNHSCVIYLFRPFETGLRLKNYSYFILISSYNLRTGAFRLIELFLLFEYIHLVSHTYKLPSLLLFPSSSPCSLTIKSNTPLSTRRHKLLRRSANFRQPPRTPYSHIRLGVRRHTGPPFNRPHLNFAIEGSASSE